MNLQYYSKKLEWWYQGQKRGQLECTANVGRGNAGFKVYWDWSDGSQNLNFEQQQQQQQTKSSTEQMTAHRMEKKKRWDRIRNISFR